MTTAQRCNIHRHTVTSSGGCIVQKDGSVEWGEIWQEWDNDVHTIIPAFDPWESFPGVKMF